jgi:Transcriptional regulators
MALQRETSVGYMTNLAGRLLVRALERRLLPLGMTPALMPVLMYLEAGPMTQKDLAECVGVEQPTMAATIKRLERDGWIQRLPNPDDGRSSLVSLTDKARQMRPKVEAVVDQINATALTGFSSTEREQYFALLTRIIKALEADTGSD